MRLLMTSISMDQCFCECRRLTVGGFGVYHNMNTYPGPDDSVYGTVPLPQTCCAWTLCGRQGRPSTSTSTLSTTTESQEGIQHSGAGCHVRRMGIEADDQSPLDKFNLGATLLRLRADQRRRANPDCLGQSLPTVHHQQVGSYVIPPGSEQWPEREPHRLRLWIARSEIGFFVFPIPPLLALREEAGVDLVRQALRRLQANVVV